MFNTENLPEWLSDYQSPNLDPETEQAICQAIKNWQLEISTREIKIVAEEN